MSDPPTLARLLESFFRRRLVEQRNATAATVAAYRDALRLLILYASENVGCPPCNLSVTTLIGTECLIFSTTWSGIEAMGQAHVMRA